MVRQRIHNQAAGLAAALFVFSLAQSQARAADGKEQKEPVQVPPSTQRSDTNPAAGTEKRLDFHGYLRVRGGLFFNFDLNHGPTPSSGLPLWPETLTGGAQSGLDMRLRVEPRLHIGWGVWVFAQIDMLDNLRLGSTPDAGYGYAATQQLPPADSIKIRQAYGQVLLPFGVLSAGRMGALVNWGTGMLVNKGDCLDCERGDVGDRITFLAPLLGHFIGAAFDIAAIGADSNGYFPKYPAVNIDRKDDVRNVALTFFKYDDPPSLRRKLSAKKTVFNYGLLAAVRWQDYDAGDVEEGAEVTKDALIWRGAVSVLADLWLRLNIRGFRAELEFAVLWGRIENASTDPGVDLLPDITALQTGGVLQLGWESARRKVAIELELVYASGDDEYGMGANPDPDQVGSLKGDLDGPQFSVPGDRDINNLRLNPDFIVDTILWRRIVGRITDAVVIRPSIKYRPGSGFELSAASVTSMSVYASSAPGNANYLGTEIDVSISYLFEPGFLIRGSYALFVPGSGMDNVVLGHDAGPAHLGYVLMAFMF
ncbi:MAG: TIGR04551 family protein [Pseudomonadota bacterium]